MMRPSTVIEFKPAQSSVPNTAEAWCARLHADDVTEKDRSSFEDWISASAANRAEYELCALAFGLARGLANARAPMQGEPVFRKPKTRRFLAAAAVFLACITGMLGWYLTRATYATDVGEQKLISLADGTTVQLNTDSAMKVELEKSERYVRLNRGEAYFNVAQDPARPFIVKAGAGEIRVLGTKFNVRVDGDNASIIVLEGRVKVDSVDLRPGEGARIAAAQRTVKVADMNAMRLTSWREGKIYFDQDPLSIVLQEVNRYTETPFVIERPAIMSLRLSGVFRTGDTGSVAFALRQAHGLTMEPQGSRILVR